MYFIFRSPLTSESGGEINIEKHDTDGRPRSPFDWRKVQVS